MEDEVHISLGYCYALTCDCSGFKTNVKSPGRRRKMSSIIVEKQLSPAPVV